MRRVVVPVDFSPLSKYAFRFAVDLVGACDAEIHILHVVPEYEIDSAFHIQLPDRAELEQHADQWAQRAFDNYLRGEDLKGLVPVLSVRYGKPERVICGYATEVEADMIIIASHGRSGFQRAVFGSVAEKVLRISELPVTVVKGKH